MITITKARFGHIDHTANALWFSDGHHWADEPRVVGRIAVGISRNVLASKTTTPSFFPIAIRVPDGDHETDMALSLSPDFRSGSLIM